MALTIREKNLLLSAIGDPEAAEAIADAIDEAGTVGTADIEDLAVTTGKLAANAVTDAKLRTSAALSVIGRGANSTGNVADLAAGTDGFVLRRSGTTLAFGTIAPGAFAALSVETAAINDLAVTEGKLNTGAVTVGKIGSEAVTGVKLHRDVYNYVDVTLTTAQILQLNTTPISLVPTPGAGYCNIVTEAYATMDFATAAYSAGTDDLNIKYTDGSGATAASFLNAFVEAAADSRGYAVPLAVVPVENAALVAYIGTGNPITGDSDIKIRVFYRRVPVLL